MKSSALVVLLVACGNDQAKPPVDDGCGLGTSGSCIETRGEYCINYEATPLACNGAVVSYDEDSPCDRRFAVACCRIDSGTDTERVKLYNAPMHDVNSATIDCNRQPGTLTVIP